MKIRSSADGRCHTWPARWLHFFGAGLFRRWTGHLLRARVLVDRAHATRHGPYVFAGNHRSFGDPPFIGCWCDQPLAYFARASLWRLPVIGWTLSIFQSVPVDRSRPGAGASMAAIDRLKQGISIVVFPEGTRSKDGRLQRLREGPALFARKAGVPVVPVYVHRTESWWPRGCPVPLPAGPRLEVRYGPPIVPPPHLPEHLHDRFITIALQRWMERQERSLLERRG